MLGGTYSGNPVACAAALAVLDIYEKEDLAARSRAIGATIMQHFTRLQERYACIGEVRGLGCMIAMELVKDRATHEPDAQVTSALMAAAHKHGLVLIKAGMYDNVLRVLVPLAVTDEQLRMALDIFDAAFAEVASPVASSVRTE